MTWNSFHHRGEILRTVIATADARRDGILPTDVAGVTETFGDDLTLLGVLQLRWHTRLSGRIERELMYQPLDLEQAVIDAWQATAAELPGIRAILDHHRAEPHDEAMAEAMGKAAAKEWTMLAVMAGQVSMQDDAAVRAGELIESKARATSAPLDRAARRPLHRLGDPRPAGLIGRIKAAIAA